jgi:transcriptional regulator with XRE-family HTH domain
MSNQHVAHNATSRPYPKRKEHEMPIDTASLPMLARQIHALRRDHGWSQPDLAAKINAHHTMIGRYERGEMTPAVDVVAKLAEAFSVTIDHLYHGSNAPDVLQDKVMVARCQSIAVLPQADRTIILAALDAMIRDAKTRQNYGNGGQGTTL